MRFITSETEAGIWDLGVIFPAVGESRGLSGAASAGLQAVLSL